MTTNYYMPEISLRILLRGRNTAIFMAKHYRKKGMRSAAAYCEREAIRLQGFANRRGI